ncbi:caspase domain-containing protein [Glycomyces mayteni]|uniref:Caspase domain-containing protein n=1 Tax=Glycomyces mayteni TaxID=543887 RepID=A0ABW2D749_9ACTN|nr:hypothetical protein GCM10025732_11510 [Glycomyces mayteni]
MSIARYRAMLIGNALYLRDPVGLPRLRGPGADVAALYEALTDPAVGLFDPDGVEALLDRPAQELHERLERFFIEEATRDDTLLLYYSGHGKIDLNGRLHLCALDSQTSRLHSTSLRYAADIEALIDQSPARSIVTVIDSCHSGAFRGDVAVTATGRGRCVMASAGADQLVRDEVRPDGPSPFTAAFADGLRLAESSGHLTTQELYHYIERDLRSAGVSRPQFRFDGEGSITLARRDTARAPEEPIAAGTPELRPAGLVETPEPAPADFEFPAARDQVSDLLRRSLRAALDEPDEEDEVPATAYLFFLRAGPLDERWCAEVLTAMPRGELKEAAVEGYVQGLAALDGDLPPHLTALFKERPFGMTARIAAARGLGEDRSRLATDLLGSAREEIEHVGGDRFELRGLTTLLIALLSAHDPRFAAMVDPEAFPPQLLSATRTAFPERERWYANLVAGLRRALRKVPAASRAETAAETGVRLAPLLPTVALEFLAPDDDLLPDGAFDGETVHDLAAAAAAIHRKHPALAYRLLKVAGRRTDGDTDPDDMLGALLIQFEHSDPADSKLHDLLLHEVELLVTESDGVGFWLVQHHAETLSSTLPWISERLFQLDPDDSRTISSIEEACQRAATVDVEAARRMASAAERMAVSIPKRKARNRAKVGVVRAYAAFSLSDALRVAAGMHQGDNWISVALQYAATIIGKRAPEQIDALIAGLPATENPDRFLSSVVQGIAEADPHRALELVPRLGDPVDRSAALVEVVKALAPSAPGAAADIARSIEDPYYRGQALRKAAICLAATEPAAAEAAARQIPDDPSTLDHKIIVLASLAGRLKSPKRILAVLSEAERLLDMLPDDEMAKAEAARSVGEVHAVFDPAKAARLFASAERYARAIEDDHEYYRSAQLADLMIAWAAVAPARSEDLARRIPTDWTRFDSHVEDAGLAMAHLDPRRAERMLHLMQDEGRRVQASSRLAEKLSRTSTARAERIAMSLPHGRTKALTLLTVAEALCSSTPPP